MKPIWVTAVVLAFAFGSACSGSVSSIDDSGGARATAGEGGSAGTPATLPGSGGTAPSHTGVTGSGKFCFDQIPTPGGTCQIYEDTNSYYCEYANPGLCDIRATCVNGTWELANADRECSNPPGSVTCPFAVPALSSPCSLPPTFEAFTCFYGEVCPHGMATRATCFAYNHRWSLDTNFGCAGDSGQGPIQFQGEGG